MKVFARAALVIGLAVMIVLIAREGARSIMTLLAHAGWTLLLLVPLHTLPLFLDVLGWRALIGASGRVRELFLIASIREAINRLLPVANVGGEIVGVRLLAQQGMDIMAAAASVIVEVLLNLISQYLFLVLGVVCILRLTNAVPAIGATLLGLGAALSVLGTLIALLHNGWVFRRIERLAQELRTRARGGLTSLRQATQLHAAIRTLLGARGRLLRALGWQFAGLIAGCAETWLALRWLGTPVGVGPAIVLESVTQAARHLIFIVPAGLGVQEAGLIGACHLFGLGRDVAIALSLAKRMREILFGLPALIAWQWIEGRRGFLRLRRQ